MSQGFMGAIDTMSTKTDRVHFPDQRSIYGSPKKLKWNWRNNNFIMYNNI